MAEKQKQIIDYTPATTLATGDKLLLQKADGSTMNVDYAELARNIITQYNAQTLAGSAQTVKSALDALSSNPTVSATRIEGVSFNTIVAYGSYACLNCTDTPNDAISWYNLEVIPQGGANNGNSKYPTQIATQFHSYNRFIRYCDNGTWSSWQKLPTRDEIDTLNSNLVNKELTKLVRYTGSDDVFNDLHNEMKARSVYDAVVQFSVAHSVLGSASGHIHGFYNIPDYGMQFFESSDRKATRYVLNGTWTNWQIDPKRSEIDALNNRLGTLRYISVTNGGTFTITFRGGYACALIFGIINSKRYVILISPGNGTPIVEYVYRADESATINVTSVSATSLNITSDRGNDFVIVGEFLSVLRSE